MSDQLLLPPPAEGKPFDFDGYAHELKATPKEVYKEAIEPEPEPPPMDPPPSAAPEPDAGPKASESDTSSAKFIVHMYDTAVCKVCEAMVDEPSRYPAKHFAMEPMLRDQAEEQLSKGLAEGGMLKSIPWWVALLIVMAFHGAVTWWAVRGAKRDKREREEAAANRTRHQQRPQAPVEPSSIVDRHGKPVSRPTPAPPAPSPAASPAPPPVTGFGDCEVCGNPVHHRGRKYCGKSCAGKATSKAYKQAHR